MKTTTLWDQYQHYTRDLTVSGRQLGFAAGTILWAFAPHGEVATATLWAMAALAMFFFCDILQGVAGAITIKLFTERREAILWASTGRIDGEVDKPRWVDRPALAFFALKIAFLCLTYAMIFAQFLARAVAA